MDDATLPEYMRRIMEGVERELAEQNATSAREVAEYLCDRFRADEQHDWSHAVVGQNLALLHEGLIECVGFMEVEILTLLYMSTIARGCFVRANDQTGEYQSARILLAQVDDVIVTADTADGYIRADTCDRTVMQLKLPWADRIQSQIQRYYDIARSARKLETITMPWGETLQILFDDNA